MNESKSMPRTKIGLLYSVVIFCVFSFKVILIPVSESGVRLDDILILVAAIALLNRGALIRIHRSRPLNLYLLFVAANLFSALWNSARGRVELLSSVFFTARLLEYIVAYYIGYSIAPTRNLARVMTVYLAVLSICVPLQMTQVLPSAGDFAGISSRAVGNTNGPYELAVVAAFLLCFLGYERRKRIHGLAAFGLIVLSASRVTFVGTLVSGIRLIYQKSRLATRVGLIIVATSGAVFLWIAGGSIVGPETGNQIEVINRISTAASFFDSDRIFSMYDSVPTYDSSKDYIAEEFEDARAQSQALEGDEGEVSGAIRVFRWASLIKSAMSSIETAMVGLGPSFGTSAVDGYFVRVFIETGIVGLITFSSFAFALMRERAGSSWSFREYFFILLVSCTFIDIGASYKPMFLLWLWYGMQQGKYYAENRAPESQALGSAKIGFAGGRQIEEGVPSIPLN